MTHLKRFKNWLVIVYYACWKYGEQFHIYQNSENSIDNQSFPAPIETLDASLQLDAEASNQIVDVIEAVQPQRMVLKTEEVSKPSKEAKTVVEDNAALTSVAPVKKIEPRKVTTPQQQAATQVPAEPTIKDGAVKASPVVPVKADPAKSNGATEASATNGKYQPGAVNEQTAQRLARLLVSEIKLYYKSKSEGEDLSEDNNIYDILKDPIEKSRQHYKKRMGATAMETMPDYFHGELVRSLCGGDATRLGPNYPAGK